MAASHLNQRLRMKAHFPCTRIEPSRPVASLAEDVRGGLLHSPRSLPPKYFYDGRGALLFERICDLPEYYLTRTEAGLLAESATTIIDAVRPARILELGSGAATKTRLLLDACAAMDLAPGYAPFDVCEDMLQQSAEQLSRDYPWLSVTPMCGDFSGGLAGLPVVSGTTLYVFLGSSIGNFAPAEARELLRDIRSRMRGDDRLLIGFDRFKDPAVLHAAYNDSSGVTAAFNLNLLRVLNRDLGADFDASAFRHLALVNSEARRVEMYLEARSRQSVWFSALRTRLRLETGERIMTEMSHKYEREDIAGLLADSGLQEALHFCPDNKWYSLVVTAPLG